MWIGKSTIHIWILTLWSLASYAHAKQFERLLLISFDGFRWDYLSKVDTPNFDRFIANGVKADWIKDTYTSLTFPNHYTIVTGLYEESHGIVANEFYDPDLGMEFHNHNVTNVQDGRFWGGEPIWVTNQKNGGTSGVFYWVGSEAEIKGYRPNHYANYTVHNASMELWVNHTDQVIDWMTDPKDPVNLALLYFKEPDATGHRFGPDSPEVEDMIRQCDNITGYILDQIAEHGLNDLVNIIITSDHGMTNMSKDRFITLDGHVDETKTDHFLNYVIGASVWPKSGFEDEIYKNLSAIDEHVKVWRKSEIPAEYHYSNNKRIPEILMAADEGWGIKQNWDDKHYLLGRHGFNNSEMDMHPIFLASGPSFKKGYVSKPFENVQIYGLMCELLNIVPAPNNGSLDAVSHLLADNVSRSVNLVWQIALLVGGTLCVILLVCIVRELFKPYLKKPKSLHDWDDRSALLEGA